MDGRRNFSPDPDAEPRWYPDDRGYDERGRDDRRDERLDDRRDDRPRDERPREERPRDERGYGDDRGYTPTRYADDRDRDYDDGYRVPEPRGAARGYGDPVAYGDSPSGQFSAPLTAGSAPEIVDVESVSRSRRSEAIERGALQRPVSGGAPSSPAAPLPPPVTVPTAPQAAFGQQHSFAAPTTLTAAVPPPVAAAEPGGAVYRSKRPGLAIALVLLTVVFEVPVLRLFLTAMTADKIEAAGTLASIFMILGLPMFALGLYGLIGGAAASAPGARAWLRTPLAYLPIAVLLFIAAALST